MMRVWVGKILAIFVALLMTVPVRGAEDSEILRVVLKKSAESYIVNEAGKVIGDELGARLNKYVDLTNPALGSALSTVSQLIALYNMTQKLDRYGSLITRKRNTTMPLAPLPTP